MCQRRRFSFFVHPQNELRTNIHEWSDEVVRMNIESYVMLFFLFNVFLFKFFGHSLITIAVVFWFSRVLSQKYT